MKKHTYKPNPYITEPLGEPPKPPKKEDIHKEMQEAEEILLEEKERQKIIYKTVNMLFKKQKELIGIKKNLKKLEQPIVILLRNWKDIEVYEGIKGNTFIVPLPPEHSKAVKIGEDMTKKPGKRTAYLSPSDLYTLQYGNDTLKAYVIHESDAIPIGANTKVWSERLEYTIDAILLNFENYKKKNDAGPNDWIVNLVKYGGLILLGYILIKVIWPDAPTPSIPSGTVGAAISGLRNTSGITVIG